MTTKNNMRSMVAKRVAAVAEPVTNDERSRGAGELVSLTIRMSRDNWMALKMFAMHEGTTMQGVVMNGINLALAAKGQPPLKESK